MYTKMHIEVEFNKIISDVNSIKIASYQYLKKESK